MQNTNKKSSVARGEANHGDTVRHGGPIELIAAECIACGLCVVECGFLRNHGLPKQIAETILGGDENHEKIAFSCSLCRLCSAVCPRQLPMAEMFLDLRRRLVRRGEGTFRCHWPLRFYEWIGSSALFTTYRLPQGCREVFFPGCTLCGIRPEAVKRIVEHLRRSNPKVGVVLDCCNKPSHDLGEQMHFLIEFGRKLDYLLKKGVERVIVGCPSCYRTFSEYGGALKISMVFEHLSGVIGHDNPPLQNRGECVVHDPCSLRFNSDIHLAVRSLVSDLGLEVAEMKHHGVRTLCCGEGGAAMQFNSLTSANWQSVRKAQMHSVETITYCAGCTMTLHSPQTKHLVDLIFPSTFPSSSGEKDKTLPRPPKTYFNRLKLKIWLMRIFQM